MQVQVQVQVQARRVFPSQAVVQVPGLLVVVATFHLESQAGELLVLVQVQVLLLAAVLLSTATALRPQQHPLAATCPRVFAASVAVAGTRSDSEPRLAVAARHRVAEEEEKEVRVRIRMRTPAAVLATTAAWAAAAMRSTCSLRSLHHQRRHDQLHLLLQLLLSLLVALLLLLRGPSEDCSRHRHRHRQGPQASLPLPRQLGRPSPC